ncbi:MAG: HD domain-containing protein [Thermoplasmata archaeon]
MPERAPRNEARKSIYDPVHGPIVLEGSALELIGTAEFQRLWGIRQTGLAHLVFPGANHTRLEHSLGVFWVARRISEGLGLPARDRRLVEAGALLHDLGHPPFSHTLEPTMREVLGHGHERRSRQLIVGSVRSDGDVAQILRRAGVDPDAVADLVDPVRTERSPSLLRSLLHGAVDADRLDYLQRDAYYTGVAHGAVDLVRILDTFRRAGDRLVIASKGRSAIEGFLVGRSLMYSAVYYHKTVRAAELMTQAAVERAIGFPSAAVDWLGGTDGDLLLDVGRERGAVSRRLIEGLRRRRLYKRAHVFTRLTPDSARRWRRLAHRPKERRALEDSLADRFRSPPGSLLIDLAGIEPRDRPDEDGRTIALLDGSRLVYPFRASSPWSELARRPPSETRAAIYTVPSIREAVARWLRRSPSAVP